MKIIKFYIYFCLLLATNNIFGYTFTIHNLTDKKISIKLDLYGPDKDVTIFPGEVDKKVDTGLLCARAIEARSGDTFIRQEIKGWCAIPWLTNKSRNYDVYLQYSTYLTPAGEPVSTGGKGGAGYITGGGGQLIQAGLTMTLR